MTHLTNFSGDKKAWPVYMTIGNLSATVRGSSTSHSIVLVALMPVPSKLSTRNATREAQKERNRLVHQTVLRELLAPVIDSQKRKFNALCADSFYRRCVLSVGGWIADYPEHCCMQGIKNNMCFWCECPRDELGDLKRSPRRDHVLYESLSESNTPHSVAELDRMGVNPGPNVLWKLDCIVADIPKSDLLYTMQLGMMGYILKWLQHFLEEHSRFDQFNNIWLAVPPYLDMAAPSKPYAKISQWSGKEYKTMSRYLLPVLRNALRGGTPSERRKFDDAIECTRALLEFYMFCQYDSHDPDILQLMEDALRRFHRFQRILSSSRNGK